MGLPQGKKGPQVTTCVRSSAFSPNGSSQLGPAGAGQVGLSVPLLGVKQPLL